MGGTSGTIDKRLEEGVRERGELRLMVDIVGGGKGNAVCADKCHRRLLCMGVL